MGLSRAQRDLDGEVMNKGLALRLVSVVLFGGVAIAACSGKPTTGSSADAGHNGGGNRDAQTGPSGDATIIEAAAGDDAEAGTGDDGSQDAGPRARRAPRSKRGDGQPGVQTCTSSGRWADRSTAG